MMIDSKFQQWCGRVLRRLKATGVAASRSWLTICVYTPMQSVYHCAVRRRPTTVQGDQTVSEPHRAGDIRNNVIKEERQKDISYD